MIQLNPLNKLDYIVIIIFCIITIGIAGYDLSQLGTIKQDCLTKCNEHWVKEFKTKCVGTWGQEENIPKLIFDLNETQEKD